MKFPITGLSALSVAMGLVFATSALAADLDARQNPVAPATDVLVNQTDSVTFYSLGVDEWESETIFCDGFDVDDVAPCIPTPATSIVYSGPLDIDIPPTASGLRINFVTGEAAPGIPHSHFSINKGDPYLYGPGMFFFWGSDANNGGVALTNNGPYLVLGSGDTIGPASIFISHSIGTSSVMFDYWAGVEGYLGVRFVNEETDEINYGYVHLLTTHGTGYPAMILDYAYDKSGAAITIP